MPHHDASTFTINIALNRVGIDYEVSVCRCVESAGRPPEQAGQLDTLSLPISGLFTLGIATWAWTRVSECIKMLEVPQAPSQKGCQEKAETLLLRCFHQADMFLVLFLAGRRLPVPALQLLHSSSAERVDTYASRTPDPLS